MKQHLLGSYLDALGSIIAAQIFKGKAMQGGLSGAKRLAKMPDLCRLLNSIGELPRVTIFVCLEQAEATESRSRFFYPNSYLVVHHRKQDGVFLLFDGCCTLIKHFAAQV